MVLTLHYSPKFALGEPQEHYFRKTAQNWPEMNIFHVQNENGSKASEKCFDPKNSIPGGLVHFFTAKMAISAPI